MLCNSKNQINIGDKVKMARNQQQNQLDLSISLDSIDLQVHHENISHHKNKHHQTIQTFNFTKNNSLTQKNKTKKTGIFNKMFGFFYKSHPKKQQSQQHQQKQQSQQKSQAKEQWRKIKNAIITVRQLKICKVQKINSEVDLTRALNEFQKMKNNRKTSNVDGIQDNGSILLDINEAPPNLEYWQDNQNDDKMLETFFHLKRMNVIDNDGYLDFLRTQQLMSACEKGGQKNLQRIIDILNNDPRKYVMDTINPLHLINKRDQTGQFPLYIAAKNGNLEIVKFLISQQVLARQTFSFHSNKEESIHVAARWNHWEIVQFMLEKVNYESYIKSQFQKRLNDRKKQKKKTKCCLY